MKEFLRKIKPIIENVKDFFRSPSYTRTLAMIGLLILVIALPVTVVFLGQRTNTQQHAMVDGGGGSGCTSASQCSVPASYCSSNRLYTYTASCVSGKCQAASSPKPYTCGVCGYTGAYTHYGQCYGTQVCDISGTACTTSISVTNCNTIGGKCGAPLCGSAGIGGTCMYGGCTNGNNPNGGYCASTSQQCCKVPPPTPTAVPACQSFNGGKAACSNSGCNPGDSVADHGINNYSGCGSLASCCWSGQGAATGNGNTCTAAGGQCYAGLSGCPSGTTLKSIPSDDGGRCASPTFCCVKPLTDTCPTFQTSGDKDCVTEAKVNSVTKSCLHPENYVLSSHEWSWINPFSPIGFGGYINTCTYNGTKSTTIACGKDTYGGKTTYCSTGVYDSTNHLACPGGDGAPISTNYTGCGNYVFCCASHNGTIPPAPTLSKGLACQAAGGTCYFNLSGCANGMVSIGAKDCNAPQFCCAESSKGDNPGCDPTKQNCGGPANSPTPSCTNGKTTQLVLNIKLPGIGGGTFENNTPAHVTKHGSLVVKDGAGTFLFGQSHDYSHGFGHANGNGKLGSEKVNLGTQAVCGKTYTVEVKLPGYITIKKTVVYGQDQTIDVGENDVTPGDIVGNNNNNFITPDGKIVGDDVVNILDYNVMKDCRNASASAGLTFQNNTQNVTIKCGDLINFFDYTDGGTQESVVNNAGIGEWDANYNMWLRGFIKANGY